MDLIYRYIWQPREDPRLDEVRAETERVRELAESRFRDTMDDIARGFHE